MTFSFSAINISEETDLSSSGSGVPAEQMSPQVNVLSFTPAIWTVIWLESHVCMRLAILLLTVLELSPY